MILKLQIGEDVRQEQRADKKTGFSVLTEQAIGKTEACR